MHVTFTGVTSEFWHCPIINEIWCQAKFLTSAKLLTYICLSDILLLRVKE